MPRPAVTTQLTGGAFTNFEKAQLAKIAAEAGSTAVLAVAVPGSARSVTVPLALGAPYAPCGHVATWQTTVGFSALTVADVVLTFGTRAPAAGGTLYLTVARL